MIGVLMTSTCHYPGIDKQPFSDRVEELCHSMSTLERCISQPFELIVADNSPADCVPTEKILNLRPRRTLFLRSTENEGKPIGGFIKNKRSGLGLTVTEYLRRDHNPIFETTEDYDRIPRVEIEDLL